MAFSLDQIVRILKNTPEILDNTFNGLSKELYMANEGPDTWSPYEVVGHLIHGEKTDWVVRTKIILGNSTSKEFAPYDRFAQQKGPLTTLPELLDTFRSLRNKNLHYILDLNLTDRDLLKIGIHPELGEVTLQQLLSTWAVHDLSHIVQINRVLAKQFKTAMGPWPAYFSLLQ
ncbi:MAG: DinB family protein [Gilvibacter sp.]